MPKESCAYLAVEPTPESLRGTRYRAAGGQGVPEEVRGLDGSIGSDARSKAESALCEGRLRRRATS
eukprot:11038620-Prorocentrum_lima.AAC.1